MAKFYAVKVGRVPGIYTSWDDCKLQVDGFPSASYKSFKTASEAAEYMGICECPKSMRQDKADNIVSSDEIVAYVDGSYNDVTKEFSYGVVIFYDGEEIHLSERVDDESLVSMRNVAGEIKGAEAAMRYADEHLCKSLTIYHDYEGIAKWCTGEWKANKDGTIAYRLYYSTLVSRINIKFVKVKGHSNDRYNDLADSLAKQAIGLE